MTEGIAFYSLLSFRFNGHIPDGSGLAGTTTRTSPLWILLELRLMEVVVG